MATLSVSGVGAQPKPRVGIFASMAEPALAEAVVPALRGSLADAGLATEDVTAETLSDPSRLTSDAYRLLLMVGGSRYPARMAPALQSYLKAGGRLVVLGGPPFTEALWRVGDRWESWITLQRRMAAAPPEHLVAGFEGPAEEEAKAWSRSTNDPSAVGKLTVADHGSGRGSSLQVDAGNLSGWDTWDRPVSGFPAGRRVVALWIKGDANTPQVQMELRERDGSRWIAVMQVSTEWEYRVLEASDFKYWYDSTSKGRGGAGDRVRFENVAMLGIGLAYTHTQIPGGPHRYWVDEIAVRPDPRPEDPGERVDLVLDGLTPSYKVFPIRGAATARAGRQAFVPDGAYPIPPDAFSVSPRPYGTGFDKDRSQRFVPLIEARDAEGRRSGYLAWAHLNGGQAWAGSAWACFGSGDPGFYRDARVRAAVTAAVVALATRPYLYEGGSERFAYHHDEPEVTLGCRVVLPHGQQPDGLRARVTVRAADGGREVADRTWTLSEGLGDVSEWPSARVARLAMQWKPPADWAPGTYTVTTELLRGDERLDVLTHELNVWRPKPPAERRYVSARDGDFWLDGKRWAAHGLNYMPSSGIALEEGQTFEHWIGARGYDPEIIEEDLERIASLGMNSISAFVYYGHHAAGNVLDLLARCERHGLKVNLSLRPYADPLHFNWDQVREMLTSLRLAESDVIFAYDLAWERGFGTYEPSYSNVLGRKGYDAFWRAWVLERYGSYENAEKDWGVPLPRRDGQVVGLPDEQIERDGPWRRMTAAYRRFVDDFISRAYGRAARLIRSVDPHHLISFRMTMAGDPTLPPRDFPYDFRGLARALDIMEPEGYGRIGDWPRVRDGAFTAAYSRYAAPGRPVYWAEFGQSGWSGTNFNPANPGLDTQGRLYDNFYRMMELSRVNGSAAWWFPGGFRVGENSDFGLINPDGSDRPSTRQVREWLPKLLRLGEQPRPPVDTWIEVDRDADARGLFAIYEKAKEAYWAALESGKWPGLRDEGAGTTSDTVPLVAVGNTPYNGSNPLKYLNSEFDSLEIQDASGKWVDVSGGLLKNLEPVVVEVAPGKPVRARAVVGNTQQAAWLAAKPASGPAHPVALGTPPESPLQMSEAAGIPSDVPYLGTAEIGPFTLTEGVREETEVVLQMTATGRAWFGEKIRFRLRPASP